MWAGPTAELQAVRFTVLWLSWRDRSQPAVSGVRWMSEAWVKMCFCPLFSGDFHSALSRVHASGQGAPLLSPCAESYSRSTCIWSTEIAWLLLTLRLVLTQYCRTDFDSWASLVYSTSTAYLGLWLYPQAFFLFFDSHILYTHKYFRILSIKYFSIVVHFKTPSCSSHI